MILKSIVEFKFVIMKGKVQAAYMMKLISRLYLWLGGWKLEGAIPHEIKKCVLIAVPHTSNFDYPIAMAMFYLMGINFKYLIKKESMVFPFSLFLKASGAIAVDRKKNTNLVASIIQIINTADNIVIVIPAEGTRKLVKKWKLGFYYVALGAGVPIVLSYLDYEKKIGNVGHLFYPTGNLAEDMHQIREFYKDVVPRHPENVSLDII